MTTKLHFNDIKANESKNPTLIRMVIQNQPIADKIHLGLPYKLQAT